MEQETNPALRELLRQDAAHLDSIQAGTASAREFALVFELDPDAFIIVCATHEVTGNGFAAYTKNEV